MPWNFRVDRYSKMYEGDSEQLVTYAAQHLIGVDSAAAAMQYHLVQELNRI